jgi:DnaK suppressor protein
MEQQLTDSFKQQLLTRRAELLAQISSLRGGNIGRAEASAAHFSEREPDSRAQTETERELEFTLDARESAELDAVDAALQRIANGTYGVCVDCGGGIAAPRLHAAPETLRCVGCQSQFEQHQRA